MRIPSTFRRHLPLAFFAAALVLACGIRSPLDESGSSDDNDGGVDLDASLDAEDEAAADSKPNLKDSSIPGIDTGIPALNCGLCVASTCQQPILGCVTNPSCQNILRCAVQDCVIGGSGSPNQACLLGCASGSISGGLLAFQAFECITSKCGASCLSVLGGLGGGAGGGGKGGGGGNGGGNGGGGPPPPPPL